MTIAKTWGVVQMDTYPTFDNFTNIVFTVHWNLTATDGEGHTGHTYGSVGLVVDPENGYTPYDQLTEEEVVGWVKDSLGAAQVLSYENSVAQQIADQINPPVIKLPLPWSN